MADLTFWQQAVVSGIGGLGPAAAVGFAGWLYFRRQERIRWQESTQGDLARLRQTAMVRALEAVGAHAHAQVRLLYARAHNQRTPTQASAEALRNAESRAQQAGDKAARAQLSNAFLLPNNVQEQLAVTLRAMTAATTSAQLTLILHELARTVEPYLPPLVKHRIKKSEYQ